jgi:hypothetical protein
MSINENEDEVIDDGLTQQQRELDAKMVAADFDPPYATMAAKKKVYRKKVDRRFKVASVRFPVESVGRKSKGVSRGNDPSGDRREETPYVYFA